MKHYATLETIRKMVTPGAKIWMSDTETTGFHHKGGDRVVELGGVLIVVDSVDGNKVNFRITDEIMHYYFNPEGRKVGSSVDVHGLSDDILEMQPLFAMSANEIIERFRDTVVVFHNATFDESFMSMELERCGMGKLTDYCDVFDTYFQAKNKLPNATHSLDALADRYKIKNIRSHGADSGEEDEIMKRRRENVKQSRDDVHTADIDALLLGHVFMAMTETAEDLNMGVLQGPDPIVTWRDKKRPLEETKVKGLPAVKISSADQVAEQDFKNKFKLEHVVVKGSAGKHSEQGTLCL